MEEHSDSTMFYYYSNPTTVVHKVDGSHEGSIFMSTKWTDPTKVNCLTKSTKWTHPTRDQFHVHKVDGPPRVLTVWLNPQNGRTPWGINIQSTKWTDPTKVNCLTKSTKRTDPTRFKYLTVHKVDEPHEGSIFIFTKWRTPRGYTVWPVHKVDGHIIQQVHGP